MSSYSFAFIVDGLNYSVSSGVATLTGAQDSKISTLTIPSTISYSGKTYPVNKIAGKAFWNYSNLRELKIEDSTEALLTDWYQNPNGINVEGDPFMNCPIEKIYIGRDLWHIWQSGKYDYNVCTINSTADSVNLIIAGKTNIIPKGIERRTFIGKTNITSLTIGGNVSRIEDSAFKGCVNLKSVTTLYGDSELDIASNAFTDCRNIEYFTTGRSWSSSPFSIDHINTITITSDCKQLNHLEFKGLNTYPAIDAIIFEDNDEELDISGETFDFNYNSLIGINKIYFGRKIKDNAILINSERYCRVECNEVTFGPCIKTISDNYLPQTSHNNYHSPITVNLSDCAERIDNYAFRTWKRLENINLPNTIKSIGEYAFDACDALQNIILPDGLERIGQYAFAYTPLIRLEIPSSVNYIDGNSFSHNNQLKDVIICDAEEPLKTVALFNETQTMDSVYIGREILQLQNNAFWLNCSVSNLTLAGKIETIPQSVLEKYNSLKSLTIGGSVSEISSRAFESCSSMTDLKLPSTLQKIGDGAFRYCKNLENITIDAKEPPILNSINTFGYAHNAKLTVPMGSRHSYRNDSCWKLFHNILAQGDGYSLITEFDVNKGMVAINGEDATKPIMIEEDEPATFILQPFENHKISSIILDGNDITGKLDSNNSFTIPFVLKNHNIRVAFIEDSSTSVSGVINNCKIIVNGQTINLSSDLSDDKVLSIYDINGNMIYNGNNREIGIQHTGIIFIKYGDNIMKRIISNQ